MQLFDHKGPRSRCSRQLKSNHRHSRHHFQNPTNPGSYPANPALTNPGTTKSRMRKFRGAKVQTLKNIKQNYKFFFFTISTLHLCTFQIFTIYFGCSGSVGSENSHDLPSPLPSQNNARITLHACSTCDSKANIVWWGCGGGRTSRSSTSFT